MSASPNVQESMKFPDRWLAVLRIVVGLWFFKSILTKLTIGLAWGFLPLPMATTRWVHTMPKLLGQYAAQNPIAPYKAFLLDTVLPHSVPFAHMTGVGEVVVGFGLVVGLLTPIAAFFGVIMVIFYGLAVQHMSPGQQGFHVMLFAMMIAFLFAHAGRTWGVDRWLRRRYPMSPFVRAFT